MANKTKSSDKPARKGISRRWLIGGGIALGGGLAITTALMPFSRRGEQVAFAGRDGESLVLSSLRIAKDDTLTVIYPHADMGVGNGTALAQMLAEELGADWSKVRIERAPAELAFANAPLGQAYLRGDREIPAALAGAAWVVTRRLAETLRLQITGGSTAIRLTGMEGMRHAGACARYMLTHAAAKAWAVPVEEISVANGQLTHAKSGKTSGFGAFADAAAEISPPARLPFKSRKDYTLVGQPKPRFDIPDKVTGAAIYSGDIRLPNMVFAAIRNCPVPGGTLASVDPAPAKAMRGVVDVVTIPGGVAVLADSHWRARMAVEALDPKWNEGEMASFSSAGSLKAMEDALTAGATEKDQRRGDAATVLAADAKAFERTYRVPYLAHAAMEPVGCVAHIADGKLTIWGAFQDGLGAKFAAAKASGFKPELVTINHTQMGGAFGRRGQTLNFLEQAIAIAAKTTRPVNLVYTREEDIQQDYYRNAAVGRLKASVGEKGKVGALSYRYSERNDPPEASVIHYNVPDLDVAFGKGLNKAPWGAWRSVDHSFQGFFIESFIDELAHEAKIDPYKFRRDNLVSNPRLLAALDKAAEMSGFATPLPPSTDGMRRGRGIALSWAFGTIVSQVAQVSVDPQGKVNVTDVWIAADPGLVVNPAGFQRQMESGVIYGLCAVLFGEITFEKGRVVQSNFSDYEVIKMADSPRITTAVIESDGPVGGAGEPSTPGIAPAVANAVFAATGVRVRELPMSKADLKQAATPA
jgi:isoquinoline 1-oxidoreductase subunit beta